MTTKYVKAGIAPLLLATLLIGCADKSGSDNAASSSAAGSASTTATASAEASKKPDPVKIVIAHTQGEWMWPALDKLGQEWHERTGNTVEFQYVPTANYTTWINAQLVAGTAPDIFWGGVDSPSDKLKNGQIIDLKSYFDEVSPYTGAPMRDSFLDGVLQGVVDATQGDAMIGMPLSMTTVDLYYNKTIFKELGLPDQAPGTWSEVLATADKIKSSGKDIVPFSVMNSMPWNLGWMVGDAMEDLWSNSGIVEKLDIMTPNGMLDFPEVVLGVKTGVIDPQDQRFVDYYKLLKDLSPYFNKGFNAASWEYEKLFNEGNAAMELNGSWYPNQVLSNKIEVDYGVGPVPYIDSGVSSTSRNQPMKYALGVGGPDMIVSARAQKEGRADAAVDFLRFLSDPATGGKEFIAQTMFIPTIKNVEVPAQLQNIVANIGTDVRKANMSQIFSLTPDAGTKYNDMLNAYLLGKSTPEEFAKRVKPLIVDAADQIIKEQPDLKISDYVSQVTK
ncbi:ABC transporter substrate-binding protein [Cohnella sp. GCM10020058]|uniref:ABC transporter substrate-binding protein n=1 Tax=Cohnella sp. GCM10020058 TaxID=3317330 RepID=UPI00362D5AD5